MVEISRKAILEPRDIWWERGGILNPAVMELNGRVFLLYRAVGSDHISRFGLAISDNGEDFQRFDQPVFEAAEDDPDARLGVEDPRATKIGRDIFITYTSAAVYPAAMNAKLVEHTPWRTRVSLLRTRDFQTFQEEGIIVKDIDTKDAALFPRQIDGKYWLSHRISPDVYLTSAKDLRRFDGGFRIFGPTANRWESLKVGVALPPIEVEQGWLVIYHGVSKTKVYSVGAVLLHKDNPALVLKRTAEPIITPETSWEKHGAVSNIIFPTGGLIRDEELWLYYGAADYRLGLVKLHLNDLLTALT